MGLLDYIFGKKNKEQDSLATEITETEKFVQEALLQLSLGNDDDTVYHPLYKAWCSFRQNPSQLKNIVECDKYGMGLMIFLSYGTISDINIRQQISSIAYLFISKAIKKSPDNIALYKNRLLLMITDHEAFEYTVSSVVCKEENFMLMNLMPFKGRDAMFKMEFADLQRNPQLRGIEMLEQKYIDLKDKIENGFFGQGQTDETISKAGNSLHNDVFDYLEDKVINEEDIEF